jgi:hypothetical protein
MRVTVGSQISNAALLNYDAPVVDSVSPTRFVVRLYWLCLLCPWLGLDRHAQFF